MILTQTASALKRRSTGPAASHSTAPATLPSWLVVLRLLRCCAHVPPALSCTTALLHLLLAFADGAVQLCRTQTVSHSRVCLGERYADADTDADTECDCRCCRSAHRCDSHDVRGAAGNLVLFRWGRDCCVVLQPLGRHPQQCGDVCSSGAFDVVRKVPLKCDALALVLSTHAHVSLVPQADHTNHLVRLLTISSGTVTTFAGQLGVSSYSDGVGTAATFFNPGDVALNSAGTFGLVVRSAMKGREGQELQHYRASFAPCAGGHD
jgi:hypothetical protein